jgi:hypothetical protein
MTFSEAKREFSIRYYLWAKSEFEREIEQSFPDLRLPNIIGVRSVYHLMRLLKRSDQMKMAHGLLKRFHPEAVESLREDCSREETTLVAKRDACHIIENDRQLTGPEEGKKFASKSKLRRKILTEFKRVYGSECLALASVGLDPELVFKMRCCGWILSTHFEFNGRHRQMDYCHHIHSEATTAYGGAPAMSIGEWISFTSWLGISGAVTQWEYLIDEEIDMASDAVMRFCGRFIGAAPKLLAGLEFEHISDANEKMV